MLWETSLHLLAGRCCPCLLWLPLHTGLHTASDLAPSDCFAVSCRYKLFNLARGYNKNLTQGDVSGMASCVLLSALAIPPYDKSSGAVTDAQSELEHERSMRMAAILGFNVVRF